jgi:ubiquinone biosynthesis protein UbiJ
MATQSPFTFLEDFARKLGATLSGAFPKAPLSFPALPASFPQPPAWLVQEGQRRVVLLLNHVLMQEPEAMRRLKAHAGRAMLLQWSLLNFKAGSFRLLVTPAGLFDLALAPTPDAADLTLTVAETTPLALAQAFLTGAKPAVRIEGDAAFAGDLNWLAENLRWDMEEDLSRLIGDAPAHMLAQAAERVQGLVKKGPR